MENGVVSVPSFRSLHSLYILFVVFVFVVVVVVLFLFVRIRIRISHTICVALLIFSKLYMCTYFERSNINYPFVFFLVVKLDKHKKTHKHNSKVETSKTTTTV